MWLLYLFLAGLAWIGWNALRSSSEVRTKQAAILQKLQASGFPIGASYVDVLGDAGIARNTRGDRFLLARRDANNQIRVRSLSSHEILTVGIIEDRIVLHEVQRGRGEVPYAQRKLVPPPDPNIEAAKKLMEKFGVDATKLDAPVAGATVENLVLAIVIDDESVDPYAHPFLLRFIGGEGVRIANRRGTKPHRAAIENARQWMNVVANVMDAPAPMRTMQAEPVVVTNDVTPQENHTERESLIAQLGALSATHHTQTPFTDAARPQHQEEVPSVQSSAPLRIPSAFESAPRAASSAASISTTDTTIATSLTTSASRQSIRDEMPKPDEEPQIKAIAVPDNVAEKIEDAWAVQRAKAFGSSQES